MKTWIENLDKPLVLVGFIVFILAGVITLFIKKAKVSQNQTITGNNNIAIAAGRDAKFNADKPQKNK